MSAASPLTVALYHGHFNDAGFFSRSAVCEVRRGSETRQMHTVISLRRYTSFVRLYAFFIKEKGSTSTSTSDKVEVIATLPSIPLSLDLPYEASDSAIVTGSLYTADVSDTYMREHHAQSQYVGELENFIHRFYCGLAGVDAASGARISNPFFEVFGKEKIKVFVPFEESSKDLVALPFECALKASKLPPAVIELIAMQAAEIVTMKDRGPVKRPRESTGDTTVPSEKRARADSHDDGGGHDKAKPRTLHTVNVAAVAGTTRRQAAKGLKFGKKKDDS